MSLEADELKSVLRSDETQQIIRSYSVIGKVLAADLLDLDKFNNHFLLTSASLGSQLLKTYDLGIENNGNGKPLTIQNISDFSLIFYWAKLTFRKCQGSLV